MVTEITLGDGPARLLHKGILREPCMAFRSLSAWVDHREERVVHEELRAT